MQILDSMISSVNIWPDGVITTQHYFSAFWNLHFADMACDFAPFFTPVGKFLSTLLLPITCIIIFWLYYAAIKIHQTVRRSSVVENAEREVALGFKCRRISIMFLNFAYFPIVATTISSLTPCESDSGISFLPHIPWVDCPSGTHTKLVCMGWVSLLLYVVGVPYFIFLPTLLRNRAVINDSDSREHKTLEWLGPLYTTYSESCKWFYEIVLLTRRLALASILSFLKVHPSWQTSLVCCVLTVSLVVHLFIKPFKPTNSFFPFENTLETTVLAVLLNPFAVLRLTEIEPNTLVPITSLVIGANALVILALSKIKLVGYHQWRVLIGWATSRLSGDSPRVRINQ